MTEHLLRPFINEAELAEKADKAPILKLPHELTLQPIVRADFGNPNIT